MPTSCVGKNDDRTQIMPRPQMQLGALSPGQLAKRWGLAVDRVRRLIEIGRLPGAFKVPAAGRYGETIRIPMASVVQAEQEWAIDPTGDSTRHSKPRRRRGNSPPTLTHFPELATRPAPDVACHGDDRC
jgi:hypothetical protein